MRNCLHIITCCVALNLAFAQQPYVTPAPDALGIAKLTNIPVNYYTGSSVINIPLTQTGGREIAVPISLHYNASGHKVTEMAGSTGLGWSLQAGGMITRVTRGLPDDLAEGFCKPNPSDTEPDLFFYNFLGQSGKFVLDKYGRAITTPYRDIIIKPGICISGSNGTWEIIDENGFIYKFGTGTLSRETTTVTDNSGTKSYVSTWFLTEVKTPNNTETVQFSYSTSIVSTTNYLFVKKKDPCHNNVTENLTATISINTRHIQSITGPMGSVNFSYTSGRKDITGSVYLTSMQVNTHQFQQVQKFRFEYGYFQADGCSSSDCFRLRLEKIYDLAPDPLFSFNYNTAVNLPSRYSKNFDHWGYYNANTVDSWFPEITSIDFALILPPGAVNNVNSSGASRVSDEVRMSANILTSINERGGSSREFVYEPHTRNNSGVNEIVGGVRTKAIITCDGFGNTYTRSFTYTSESNPSLTSGLLYRMPKFIVGRYNLIQSELYSRTYSHPVYDIFDLNGVNIGYSRVVETSSDGGRVEHYFTNFDSNPNLISGSPENETDLSWERGNLLRQKTFDAQGNLLAELDIEYNFNLPNKRSLTYDNNLSWSWSCGCSFPCIHVSGSATVTKKHTVVSRPFTVNKRTQRIFQPSNVLRYLTSVTEYVYNNTTMQPIQITNYDAARPSIKYITKTKYVDHVDYLGSYENCQTALDECNLYCQDEPDQQVQHYCYQDCQNQYSNCINSPPSNLDGPSLAIYYLRNRHQTAIPIETISLQQIGSSIKVLSASLNVFQIGGASGNHIQMKESWGMRHMVDESVYVYSNVQSNGNFQIDTRMKKLETYDLYDQSSGNLKRKSSIDGLVTEYEYESNNKYLQSVTTNPGSNSRTTSYTYKPLVGYSTVTDPNGITTSYDYDVYNRLKLVKDQDGNILTRYRYHYKNESPGFRITANRLEAFVNENFTFYATDVAVSSGEPPTFTWDFGDGVIQNGGTSINHTYANQGQYIVKLTLTNSEYGSVTRSLTVNVSAPMSLSVCVDGPALIDVCGIEPVYYGGCTVNNNYPYAPTNLTVTVTNGCQSSLSYYWEYRNTSYGYWTSLGTSQSVDFYPPYQEATYEVKCTVTDACYDQKTSSTYIWVYKSDPNCPGGIQH